VQQSAPGAVPPHASQWIRFLGVIVDDY